MVNFYIYHINNFILFGYLNISDEVIYLQISTQNNFESLLIIVFFFRLIVSYNLIENKFIPIKDIYHSQLPYFKLTKIYVKIKIKTPVRQD